MGVGTNYVSKILSNEKGAYVARVSDPGEDKIYGGFYRFNQISKQFPLSGSWFSYNFLLSGVDVFDINKIDNVLWISTHKGLVKYIDGNTSIYNTVTTEMKTNQITGSSEDLNGNIWVITSGCGLYKYKGEG